MKGLLTGLAFSLLSAVTSAKSTFSPARPPALPLAVKSPYLSNWLPAGSEGGDGGYLNGETPTFWNGVSKGWTGLIRVDGATYTWMGVSSTSSNQTGPYSNQTYAPAANQISFEYTTTKSLFTFEAGPVTLNVSFTSPLYPNDMKRQSLVFSYLDVAVASKDYAEHDVQVYCDITGGKLWMRFRTCPKLMNYRMGIWISCNSNRVGVRCHCSWHSVPQDLPPDTVTVV